MSETDGPYKATSFRRRGHECSTWGVEGPGVKVMDENWSRAAAEREATSFNAAWRAALEWAAGQVESVGCDRGGVPHADSCPVALAAKIREGAP